MYRTEQQKQHESEQLLAAIAARLPDLEELLKRCSGKWGYEDPIYRFYHQSLKVYYLQETTMEIVGKLRELAPHLPLNQWFLDIVREGTGKEFSLEDNSNWVAITRPIVEAFFHARFFLEMICKYGRELQTAPLTLPSGWAAVLYLFNLR